MVQDDLSATFAELDIDGAALIYCEDDDLLELGMKFRVYL